MLGLLCALALPLAARAGTPIDLRPVPAAVARRDLRKLATTLERYQPYLRSRAERRRFEAKLRALEAQVRCTQPAWRSWLQQQRLVRTLDDPHTALYPILIERRILPVTVKWVTDGVLVSPLGRSAAPPFPPDSRLLRLGRYDNAGLLAALHRLFPGTSELLRHFKHLPGYEMYWLGVVGADGRVALTVRTPAGAVRRVSLAFVRQPKGWMWKDLKRRDRNWYHWRLDRAHNVGWFTLDQMRISPAYEHAVAAFFRAAEHAGIHRIAVDLRRNGGGTSLAAAPFFVYLGVKRYRDYGGVDSLEPGTLRRQLDALERMFKEQLPQFYRPHLPVPTAPARDIFHGKFYLVTGPGCFSSAMEFAADVKYNHIGKVIGEPCAETVTGPGEVRGFFKHPPSGVPFQVSTRIFRWPGLPQGALVEPDVRIPVTVSDVRRGIDPVAVWFRRTERDMGAARAPVAEAHHAA